MMIVSVVNLKGGVGKTTTAVSLAYLIWEKYRSVALIDADPNHSAKAWAGGDAIPFDVISEIEISRYAEKVSHFVADTKARPDQEDMQALIRASDMIILPTSPNAADILVTAGTANQLVSLGSKKHRILLTKVPTNAKSTAEQDARAWLNDLQIPIFKARIRAFSAYNSAFAGQVPVCKVSGDKNAKRAWSDYVAAFQEMMKLLGK